jgi:citrate/tricarballylate utilization protein
MHGTEALREADRQMTICNACRYCEGLCAVFPAMELRRSFGTGDLTYLANLCHDCGACYDDCQFAPPHAFAVDVPKALATVRTESWQAHAWPPALAPLLERNGLKIGVIAALSIAAFIVGIVALNDPSAVFSSQTGAGAFYRLMPHGMMILIFGAAFLYAIVAMDMGLRSFWRATGGGEPGSFVRAAEDALRLRYLDGGGMGCANIDGKPPDHRRIYHHLVFYGFALCLTSTSVATVWHYAFDRIAPYPWWDLPVVLGTIGGIGLVVGPLGLFFQRGARGQGREPIRAQRGMDTAFLLMLFLAGLTGLLLLVLRATPAMGVLLALHLGVVFALFITMPYGKFVHGLYRFAALVRHAGEQSKVAADQDG